MMVNASLNLPAAFTPIMFVASTIAMNTAFKETDITSLWNGTRADRYWTNATGNTARENHSASRSAQPTEKPA